MQDDIDQLIAEFRRRGRRASAAWKLGVVMDLERVHDNRIVPFLVEVVADDLQPTDLRTHILRRIRNDAIRPEAHALVAAALVPLVRQASMPDIRAEVVLALGALSDVDGVLAVLASVALEESNPLDLRYCAFMALDRAGPTERSIAALRTLVNDEMLGPTARGTLQAWRVGQETSNDEGND
jgi:hypothetical protein